MSAAFITSSTLPSSPEVPFQRQVNSATNSPTYQANSDTCILRPDWPQQPLQRDESVTKLAHKPILGDSKSYTSSECPITRHEADFMAIPVLRPESTEPDSRLSTQIKDGLELLLTFTAVVALWGAIDVIVEMISKGNLSLELFTYVMFAVIAVFVQAACNRLFKSNISFMKALDRF
eukprot:Gregarina_sp_Poly_1__7186@NODE_3941_length_814_cov_32_147256_g2552_i0_p1_GENE_NODE_3941_length_814_cov_32_147256_g2552_i0NODE_3941_length_814_cov_32_147256_g2552_i0_p1_ORF_typecomplete_len177_score15_23Glt_symporter/PF03616_14/0_0073_NODE_3941_length_814_cov_32_147256_g2552_i0235765